MKPTQQGKVRDIYDLGNGRLLIVATNRISAFDQIIGRVPFKGKVLNQLSEFWFNWTQYLADNHMVSVPHPNAMIVRKATPIPLEVVVRGYITGVTDTSVWGSYARGERVIYRVEFPDGLRKNQKLPQPVITPTTKEEGGKHDRRITREEIISERIVPEEFYTQIEETALRLFNFGQIYCHAFGLILVDTKYEFGLIDGKLVLIDELHTPDSSRFWRAETYEERFQNGLEPESMDKEILRIWLDAQGYRGEGRPPQLPYDLINTLSDVYLEVFKRIVGDDLELASRESYQAFVYRFLWKQ